MFKEGLIVRLGSNWELSNEHVRPLMLDRSLTSDTDANISFADILNCCWISQYRDNKATHTDQGHKAVLALLWEQILLI